SISKRPILHPRVVNAERLRVIAQPDEGPPSEASKELFREADGVFLQKWIKSRQVGEDQHERFAGRELRRLFEWVKLKVLRLLVGIPTSDAGIDWLRWHDVDSPAQRRDPVFTSVAQLLGDLNLLPKRLDLDRLWVNVHFAIDFHLASALSAFAFFASTLTLSNPTGASALILKIRQESSSNRRTASEGLEAFR